MCENKSPGRGNQAAAGENKQMTTALTIAQYRNVTRANAVPMLQKLTMDDLVLLAYGEDGIGRTCDAPAWLAEAAYDQIDIRMFGSVQ